MLKLFFAILPSLSWAQVVSDQSLLNPAPKLDNNGLLEALSIADRDFKPILEKHRNTIEPVFEIKKMEAPLRKKLVSLGGEIAKPLDETLKAFGKPCFVIPLTPMGRMPLVHIPPLIDMGISSDLAKQMDSKKPEWKPSLDKYVTLSEQLKNCQGNDYISKYSIDLAKRLSDVARQLVEAGHLKPEEGRELADRIAAQIHQRDDFYRIVKQRYLNEVLFTLEQFGADDKLKKTTIDSYEPFVREILEAIKSKKKSQLEKIAMNYEKKWAVSEDTHQIIKKELSGPEPKVDATKIKNLQQNLKLKSEADVYKAIAHTLLSRASNPTRYLTSLLHLMNESRDLLTESIKLRVLSYEKTHKSKPTSIEQLQKEKWLIDAPALDFSDEKAKLDAKGMILWN